MIQKNTLPEKEKLIRLNTYNCTTQEILIDLAALDKITFYIIKQNGHLHSLSAGDIEKIYNTAPSKTHIITEPHPSGIHSFENCNWNRVWINKEIAQLLLKDHPVSETTDNKFLSTERNKMLETILGMAIHAYGYDPSSSRNNATGTNKNSIYAGIQAAGLNVTDDTIRGYLKEAKELFSDTKLPKL